MKNWMAFWFPLPSVLPLFFVLSLRGAERSEPDRFPAVPPGLNASDWSSIRSEYESHRYDAVDSATGCAMANPGQQWHAHFDGRGFTLQPDNAGWIWGLELKSYGFPRQEISAVPCPSMSTDGSRAAYNRDDTVQEWFRNEPGGLEHGFTVRRRPGHSEETSGLLTFTFAIRGSLVPHLKPDAQAVLFHDDGGAAVLTYTGLRVWDAEGKVLPAQMGIASGALHLSINESGARYPLTIDPVVQQAYLKGSSTAEGGNFGNAVAASGDTVVVGAYQDNGGVPGGGAAYVFIRTGAVWTQQAVLRPPMGGYGDSFGLSVAISGDTIVVGAPYEDSGATGVGGNQADNSAGDSGAAYVFLRSGLSWSLQGYLKASNTRVSSSFGAAVSVSGDTVVVGAPDESSNATGINGNQGNTSAAFAGAAYVFLRTAGVWAQQAYVKASNAEVVDFFASSVAISGNTMVVGAPGESSSATGVNGTQSNNGAPLAGAAYVFLRNGATWTQQAYLKAANSGADDKFGFSVAISADTVLVGANGEDSSAAGVNGNPNNDNAAETGAAYVFVRSGTVWSQQAYLKASNPGFDDGFGETVALEGDLIAVGANREASSAVGVNGDGTNNNLENSGAAYVFVRTAGTWAQQAYLKASNSSDAGFFATAVAVAGNTVISATDRDSSSAAGINGNQSDTASFASGAAYVFVRGGTNTWSQQAYVKPFNPAVTSDQFGWSVAVSGDIVVVGAPQESSAATGTGGNQADSSAANAGAAYVFYRTAGVWKQEAYLKASNTEAQDTFGNAVAAASDYVVVGASEEDSGIGGVNTPNAGVSNSRPSSGAAYIFTRGVDGYWSQQAYIKASVPANLDRFGWSMSASGETVVIGAPDQDRVTDGTAGAGAAYVFTRSGGVWTEQALLKAAVPNGDDRFGASVAISGDAIVVGAEREDSNASGVNGDQININGLNSGAAYVFRRAGTGWSQEAYLKASNTGDGDAFGWSVAISGDTVVVGANLEDSNATGVNPPGGQSNNSASGSGAAYVFGRSGGVWSQQAYLKSSDTLANNAFGFTVATTGETVIVGATSAGASGAAYVFNRNDGVWEQQAILKAFNADPGDTFGQALALSGFTLAVGAFREDSNARGINGNPLDNGAPESGAAYVYNLWSHISLDEWRERWFGINVNSAMSADQADPDGDGLPNLLEFATGPAPLTPLPLPTVLKINGELLEFTYPRSKIAHAEMQFVVEWTDSLAENTWKTTGAVETVTFDDGTVEQVKVSIPSSSSAKRFVRLRVVIF